ncbi:hypothetical protein [Streptosporangium sp. NPDC048865]|uniref:hypothetical protein n=1 Tax=Streptosporangium sp. NPDC048865 TaxID=3155766 RepID=UPI00341CC25A
MESRTGPRGFSRFVHRSVEYGLALSKAQEIVEDYETRVAPLSEADLEEARRA